MKRRIVALRFGDMAAAGPWSSRFPAGKINRTPLLSGLIAEVADDCNSTGATYAPRPPARMSRGLLSPLWLPLSLLAIAASASHVVIDLLIGVYPREGAWFAAV